MAWQIEQGEKCSRCGTFRWEWEGDHGHIEAYEADGYGCSGCEAIEVEQDRRRDMPETPGTRVVLYRKDG